MAGDPRRRSPARRRHGRRCRCFFFQAEDGIRDIGVTGVQTCALPIFTLVELLAYTGDYLSYYQDAVATEAYLETARRRISVRRHVRLIDYPMHEGCKIGRASCRERV